MPRELDSSQTQPPMKLLLPIIALACVPLLASPAAHAADAARPNILLIVSDDQGYADAGFQGTPAIPTPNLDKLAKDGVRCTRGYVTAPVCSPSRAGLMTGRYQQRFGHHNNLVLTAHKDHMPVDETVLAEVLGKAGYHTAMVGKWHLGNQDGSRPHERGFKEFFGFPNGGHDYFRNDPAKRALGDGDYTARIERNGVGVKVPGYLTDAFGDEAARIVRGQKDRPFFIYLAFNAPHSPTQAPDALVQSMPASLVGRQRRAYAAQIAAMDAAIGRVLDALRETGADRNTLVLFFSDNGGAKLPFYDNTPLRATKGTLYEGGVRVPFLAKFPGRIPAGSTCATPVTSLDVFATACALAGTKPVTHGALDSRDMLPVLAGKSSKPTHGALFWDFPSFGTAVCEGDLKLVIPRGGTPELYDLATDISEKHNLAADRPADVARLQKLLAEWKTGNIEPRWPSNLR